jgi:hypothetical protein
MLRIVMISNLILLMFALTESSLLSYLTICAAIAPTCLVFCGAVFTMPHDFKCFMGCTEARGTLPTGHRLA